jgi:hypothetical protein
MLWVFIGSWCVAMVAHIYACRYFLPMWACGFRRKLAHVGYRRKAAIGFGVFMAAWLVGMMSGVIAEQAGGWR